MSCESITVTDFPSLRQSHHNLSATHLLASPESTRYFWDNSDDACPLDESYSSSRLAALGSSCNNDAANWSGGRQAVTHTHGTIISCLLSCQRSLKQYLARRKIERGIRLYEQHNQNAAVRIWHSALKHTTVREDCYQLLGYLYQAHMDCGKYREAIEFAHHQLNIAEELDSPKKRCETYLSLARANECLGGLERALCYARHSLYNECGGSQCRTAGLVHLTVARVYLELGGFSRALEGLQGAHKIATANADATLELQVYVTLSEFFGRLHDNAKSANYAAKAYDLSRSLQLGDLNSSHHRAALLRMAAALRRQGELGDAHDYCMESTRLSLISGDQATYTRSMRIMGDIYRKKMDIDRAFQQYEQAMGISAAVGDRMAQMEAMDGAARCLESLRLQQKICNCRPLEFNTRLLEVCSSIGAKLLMRTVRQRLASIYLALGDEDQYNTQKRLTQQTDAALGLSCGVCGELLGLKAEPVEALPCSHILHAKCAQDLFRRRGNNNNNSSEKLSAGRSCPACNKILGAAAATAGAVGAGSKLTANFPLPPPPTTHPPIDDNDKNNNIDDDDENYIAQIDDIEDDDNEDDILSFKSYNNNNNFNNQINEHNYMINQNKNNNQDNNFKNNNKRQQQQQQQQQHRGICLTPNNLLYLDTSALLTKSSSSGASTPRPPTLYQSNLSLASLSLRASSLTINGAAASDNVASINITSSV